MVRTALAALALAQLAACGGYDPLADAGRRVDLVRVARDGEEIVEDQSTTPVEDMAAADPADLTGVAPADLTGAAPPDLKGAPPPDLTGVPPVTGNPDSVGTGARKTIQIDGANTSGEWGKDTLLILDPAADDARFLGTNWCAHEAPWDYLALHAAWDDTNLYVGVQFVNVTDVVDPNNLGSSAGSPLKSMDLVQFLVLDTAPGGYAKGGDMWKKNQEFVGASQPDFQLYFHSNFSQEGTYLGKWDGAKLAQVTDGKKSPMLKGAAGALLVGDKVMGVDPKSDDASPGKYGAPTVDYKQKGHDGKYDTFFELQIPLALLGLTAAALDQGSIGIMAANGDGSAVDSIPNDPATSSTTGVSASNSPLEWDSVADKDQYSVPFARVGKK